MNKRLLILYLLFTSISASAQFYLRGEVKDENNMPLPNAKILLHSTGYMYSSGGSGSFGILTAKKNDSITVSLAGYQQVSIAGDISHYQPIILKLLYTTVNLQRNRLLSFTKDFEPEDRANYMATGESYSTLVENESLPAKKYPETGFAIRIDKASYSNVRRFLNMETKVPPDAVRVEELMNYFNFAYTPPAADSVFGFTSYVSDCPWKATSQLLYLQVCAKKIDPETIPPSNLVFLIDISGSMDMPNRLPLLKSAFKLLVDNLRSKDTISIVVYGSTVGVWLPPTSGSEKLKIRKSIEDLTPGGATPGQSGIISAYRLAKSQYIKGGNNRVILATDGDFNIGQNSEDELEKLIIAHQESGIYLTCLGVGMGNYKDSKLEILAKKGKGNFAYLDNEGEAEKVLVTELTQTLYSVADNASLTIHFNDELVKEYRLIGYDNKLKALADSVHDVQGGEVGSGHSMLVLFEIVPTGRGNIKVSSAAASSIVSGADLNSMAELFKGKNMASVKVNYQLPHDSIVHYTGYNLPYNYTEFKELPSSYRFATAVAMFGSLLKESNYAKKTTWNETVILANESYDRNDAVQKEFISIVEKAKKIYNRGRKRKSFN
ncbi:MAG: von Willebrand factor type A domain-containing protein [Flavitalea sp.]